MKTTKKWASIEEVYSDLRQDSDFMSSAKKSLIDDVNKIIESIESAKTSQDFFFCICRLSSIFESLSFEESKDLYSSTNIYVQALNTALRNPVFLSTLGKVIKTKKNFSEIKKDKILFDELILLNSIISMAFFGIAINYRVISKTSIEFLRKNVTDILKNILKQFNDTEINFVDTCFLLEKIAWDNRLHHNENYDSKFPVKLNDKFLFSNLRTARSFAGIIFTSLIIRPFIEGRFKRVISSLNSSEQFNVSYALDLIYQASNELNEKLGHYYRNAPEDIVSFFNIFIKDNEKNLIYCLRIFCADFHYQGKETKFFQVIENKLKNISYVKKEIVSYMHKNFGVYGQMPDYDDNQWTHKLFLISIKCICLLEEIRYATDRKWVVNASVRELIQWIIDMHEVLNKYYIEDDWDKIKDFVVQENEIIEWKSSFFTPLEQEYISNEIDIDIGRKLFQKILKVILAMLNTDGGVLLIGVVENPASIRRIKLKEHLLIKNGVTFFDINKELKDCGKTLDNIRLQILDNLKQLTDTSADNFNQLFDIEPVTLRNDNQVGTIIKIKIKKSGKYFFNVKKEGGSVWLSLTKRAQGQNIDVDAREYLK